MLDNFLKIEFQNNDHYGDYNCVQLHYGANSENQAVVGQQLWVGGEQLGNYGDAANLAMLDSSAEGQILQKTFYVPPSKHKWHVQEQSYQAYFYTVNGGFLASYTIPSVGAAYVLLGLDSHGIVNGKGRSLKPRHSMFRKLGDYDQVPPPHFDIASMTQGVGAFDSQGSMSYPHVGAGPLSSGDGRYV